LRVGLRLPLGFFLALRFGLGLLVGVRLAVHLGLAIGVRLAGRLGLPIGFGLAVRLGLGLPVLFFLLATGGIRGELLLVGRLLALVVEPLLFELLLLG